MRSHQRPSTVPRSFLGALQACPHKAAQGTGIHHFQNTAGKKGFDPRYIKYSPTGLLGCRRQLAWISWRSPSQYRKSLSVETRRRNVIGNDGRGALLSVTTLTLNRLSPKAFSNQSSPWNKSLRVQTNRTWIGIEQNNLKYCRSNVSWCPVRRGSKTIKVISRSEWFAPALFFPNKAKPRKGDLVRPHHPGRVAVR